MQNKKTKYIKSWKDKKVNLVITVFNEEEVIERVVRECHQFIKQVPKGKLIVTEDGSTDNTKTILNKLKKKINFTYITSTKRKGATNGFRDALKTALKGADLVLFSDSDGQHKITDFFKLLKLSDRFDMVIGWKKRRKDDTLRVYGSKLFNYYLNFIYGMRLHDINCGFRVIDSKLLKEILPKVNLFKECIMTELTLRARLKGYSIIEVPISHFARNNLTRAWQGKNLLSIGSRLGFASLKLRLYSKI